MNCWFCNANTRVPYGSLNSFNCSKCKQFNGFNDDGGYNCEIPEQFYSKLNSSKTFYCQRAPIRQSMSNGLCEPCNRNQEMKVIQLANFKARCEARYDEEIEEYRQKLEDTYQLCQKCNRHLSKTLNRVKTKLIGSKISQLVSKGVQVSVKTLKKDKQIMSKVAMISIFLLSVANLIKETNTDLRFLHSITHESLLNVYYIVVALGLTIGDLLKSLSTDIDIKADTVAITAVILNAMILRQKRMRPQIIASMLFWSLKMLNDELISDISINPSHISTVKGCIAGSLVLISMLMLFKSREIKVVVEQNGSFHKIHSEIAEDSDNENDISSDISSFDCRSTRSSIYPQASNYYNSFRDQSVLRPAKTFSPMNTSHANTSIHNCTFGYIQPPSEKRMDLLSNQSFNIRQEVAAVDRSQVHKDINKLNISGSLLGSTSTIKDFNTSKNLNPFSLENSRCGSPTPSIASVFSGFNRTQIITPPRLESTFHCEVQPNHSWVAGGYWSSPMKRFLQTIPLVTNQELSRSSSQSSGLGTIDSDRNSREDDVFSESVPSKFSEPVRRRNLFDHPPETRSLYAQSFVQPSKSNNFFNSGPTNSFRKYRDGGAFLK